ncbi:MAG TPA: hypothetical protein VFL12_04400 [Thermoanaerobaculia bacterium]|nr:hypothetical protein [Thermoanaerobaculia bacterium]
MPALADWGNFYVIVGSSAGALIGLQFVVLTLVAERPPKDAERGSAAFGTPTIIHFGAVLLLSAILMAPWRTASGPAALWGGIGLAGVAYAFVVGRRMRRQNAYRPVFEDWLFHLLLPFAAYMALAFSAYEARSRFAASLFGVGGAALLLLFTGIHNAWDGVAYHVFVFRGKSRSDGPETS